MAKIKQNNQNFLNSILIFALGIILGTVVFGLLILPHAQAPTSSKLNNNIINLSSTGDEKMNLYFRAQIIASSSYFVTDDQMLSSYDSQGGMAPPRLVLMKNYQFLPNEKQENYLKDIWDYNKNDCISIWSTGGFSSVDEWTQLSGQENKYGKSDFYETIEVGNRSAQLSKLKLRDGSIYVAYMPVSTENGGVSYFFMTCNENNKQDLVSVIKSIKFRKDIKY